VSEKNKRTQWKGDQLVFDDLIAEPNSVEECLYCLTVPQTKALIAAIELYRYVTRWIGSGVNSAEVEGFVNDTQRRLMVACCDENAIPIGMFTPEGHYQESVDGGETYSDAPLNDPRNAYPIPPPFLPEGTVEPDCTYADSVVNHMINSWINATGEGETTANAISGMLVFIGSLFSASGAGILITLLFALAAAIVAFGVEAWKDAFVPEVWDRLRCNIHDNMGADGSFTQENVDAIYERIGEEETGIAALSLRMMIAAVGWQGLTIAARYGVGSTDADCDCNVYERIYVSTGGGTETDWDGEWLYASPVADGDHYTLFVQRSNPSGALDENYCCYFEFELLTGTMDLTNSAIRMCGAGSLTPIGLTPTTELCACQVAARNFEAVPFTVRVRAIAC